MQSQSCRESSVAGQRMRRLSPEVMVNRAFVAQYLRERSAVGLHMTGVGGCFTGPDSRDCRRRARGGCRLSTGPDDIWLLQCVQPDSMVPGEDTWRAGGRRCCGAHQASATRATALGLRHRIASGAHRRGYAQNRLRTIVLTLFAVTALLLTSLGVYGTLNYVVSLRRREAGLRVALGASRLGILRQFVGYALRVVCLVTAVGFLLSLAFARALSGMLFGTSPMDPVTLSSVIALYSPWGRWRRSFQRPGRQCRSRHRCSAQNSEDGPNLTLF